MTVPTPQALDVPLGDAALVWAQAGWSVFPIVPRGKVPFSEGDFCGRTDDHSCGFHCASDDQAQIAQWWQAHPDSNIGLSSPTAFIVDEDRLGALVEAGVRLPKCPYATTGRAGGGRHFFLRAPDSWAGLQGDAVKVTNKVPAVEVKGFGKGYVVAAPSVHASGARYAIGMAGYIPEAPKAVVDALADVEYVTLGDGRFVVITGGGYRIPEKVAEGNRYGEIRSYVAHLYNRRFTTDEMWAQVRMNLAPAFQPRLSERELRDRFQRATDDMPKNLGAPRGAAPAVAVGPLEDAPLTEYDSTPVEWIWPNWLPRSVVTVMDGNPGVSKSTLVADLVARITTGRPWPDGTPAGPIRRAMWITTEDDPGRVLRPRIEAAGGDAALVLFVKSEVVFPAAATAFRELAVRRSQEPLGLGLVILDPLFSHIEASVRTIADAEMRRGVMTPLTDAAEAAGVGVLVVRHFSKDTQASAINRGAGSLGGIIGAARAQWTVTADPEDETGSTKAVGVSKLNYAKEPPALRYRVVDKLPPGWVTGSVSAIEWLGAAPVSISAILAETAASRDAQPVLAGLLAQGAMPAESVYASMRTRGFGRDATRSAKSRLGVLASKSGMVGGWVWTMPESDDPELTEVTELTEPASSKERPASSASSRTPAGAKGPNPPDSSDPSVSSKSRKSGAPDRPTHAGAREGDPVVVDPALPAPTVQCHFPHDHSTAWTRQTDGSWFCSICAPAVSA